jgi:hypothetical protein
VDFSIISGFVDEGSAQETKIALNWKKVSVTFC